MKKVNKKEKMNGTECGVIVTPSVGVYPVGDGSWELRILVTDLQVERTLRVKGDLHIGGLMIKLVDELGKTYNNFFCKIFSY